jgi:hypothetical protein
MAFFEARGRVNLSFAGILAASGALAACAAPTDAAESGEVATSSAAELTARCGERHVSAHGVDAASDGTPNDCLSRRRSCRTIQHGIDVACAGDVVRVGPGEYVENVVVDRSITLAGSGRRTLLRPASSNPEPCNDSSLCDGAASNVVLVRGNDVTIHDLGIDGDNPGITSGIVRGGADIDARNGIITDHLTGRFDRLEVYDVDVRNIFLRGIAASSGGTFDFHDNRVRNVAGGPQAIAIFNFGGSGIMSRNHVDTSLDGIVSNHSSGVLMLKNLVSASGSGLHTDNAGDSPASPADLVAGNEVENCTPGGFGVWAFVPFVGPTLRDNRVVGCAVGLAAFGQGAAVTTTFADNRVDGERSAGSTGVFVTTDQLGFGSNDVSVVLSGNSIVHNDIGVRLVEQPGFVNSTTIECNRIEHNRTGIVTETSHSQAHRDAIVENGIGVDASAVSAGDFDATSNYWGCRGGPSDPACDGVRGNVDASSPLRRRPSCVRGNRCGHFAADDDELGAD